MPQRTWGLMVVPNLLFFSTIGNIGVSWNENYKCQGHCEIQYFIIVCLSSNCPGISFRYRFAYPYFIFLESFLPCSLPEVRVVFLKFKWEWFCPATVKVQSKLLTLVCRVLTWSGFFTSFPISVPAYSLADWAIATLLSDLPVALSFLFLSSNIN